jgi:hypothetical protein
MSTNFDSDNLQQIVPNKHIDRANKQLATVNKTLTAIRHQKFIEFLAQNESAARHFITLISRSSNVVDMVFIDHYTNQLNWLVLSGNDSLLWNEALIERYEGKWDWGRLSDNQSLPWSEALIDSYVGKWGWGLLCKNFSLSEKFIKHQSDR